MNSWYRRTAFLFYRTVLVCLALVVAGARDASAQDYTSYGVVGGYSLAECNKASELGSGAFRTGFTWYALQPSPGATIDFSGNDAFLDCLMSNHITRVLAGMAYAPSWAGGNNSDHPSGMPDMNAWRDFVAQVIGHYNDPHWNGLNIVFSVWNEPDGDFLVPGGASPSQYATLFSYASQGRDLGNPNARLAGPELGSQSDTGVFSQYYAAIQPYLEPQDVITVHWYPSNANTLSDYMNAVVSIAGGRETWMSETGSDDPLLSSTRVNNMLINFYSYFTQHSNSPWTAVFWFLLPPGDNSSLLNGDPNDPGTWTNSDAFTAYQTNIRLYSGGPAETDLQPGAMLNPGTSASSPSGEFVLTYQTDGNFVLYDNGAAVWAINCWPNCSGTGFEGNSFTPAGYATMQTDGNLVVYNASGGPVWATFTNGNPGAYLAIGNDGSLVVYDPNRNVLWHR